MEKERFTAIFLWHKREIQIDLDIPYDISANDLILALNQALGLGLDTSDLSRCHLKTENPIALLRGTKCLRDYHLRHSTIIHFTQ